MFIVEVNEDRAYHVSSNGVGTHCDCRVEKILANVSNVFSEIHSLTCSTCLEVVLETYTS
jgi:hypothetical protein